MATSHDVARLAGVSQPTVSRALRGRPGVSSETIERVRAAAALLDYVPSEAGRALSTRRTHCVGIVAGELTNPFYPELVEPMRSELERHGYRALLVPDMDESSPEIGNLADGTLDGVLLTTSTLTSPLPGALGQRGIPFVLVNRTVDGVDSDRCVFDNASGAAAVGRMLFARGHRRIGMICGPPETSTGRQRERGFKAVMDDLGFPVEPGLVRYGPFSFETGHRCTLDLLTSASEPTAIFCGNDVIAVGAVNALRAAGRSAAQAVSIVGFDDIAMASWDLFRITTVRGDIRRMAQESVRLLLRRLEDPGAAFEHVVLPTELVDRFPD